MIDVSSRPRLASKTRLRFDRKTARYVLLFPEKALLLNRTGSAVAVLCTGEHSVESIIDQLAREHADVGQQQIEQEVLTFLTALCERGLLEIEI